MLDADATRPRPTAREDEEKIGALWPQDTDTS